MTLTAPDAEAPAPRVLIRYANQCGALVTVTKKPGTPGGQSSYGTACAGCLDALFGSVALGAARDWASKHAERCRALPQPEADSA